MRNKIEIQNRINRLKLNEKKFIKEIGGAENMGDIDPVLISMNRAKIKVLEWVLGGEE